jgi:hypothetical protein
MTRCGAITVVVPGPDRVPARRRSRRSSAASPMARTGWATALSLGKTASAQGRSSMPMTEMSCGQARPRAAIRQRLHDTDRHQVVGGEDGAWRLRQGQQFGHHLLGRLLAEAGVADKFGVERQPSRQQRLTIARETLGGRAQHLRSVDAGRSADGRSRSDAVSPRNPRAGCQGRPRRSPALPWPGRPGRWAPRAAPAARPGSSRPRAVGARISPSMRCVRSMRSMRRCAPRARSAHWSCTTARDVRWPRRRPRRPRTGRRRTGW